MKRALITGINGMDGSHLADLLLEKGYKVYGMERRSSSKNRTNTGHLEGTINFITGDLTDQNSLLRCLKESDPDEVYNLGSQSFVGESWNTPEQTSDVTGLVVFEYWMLGKT
jgi:GDPmannose 4,6-dehydratase